ncbi:ABC-2 family transporter protein [compost metagenome]
MKLINYIRNENMKIYKRKRTWVLIALVAVFVILQIINVRAGDGGTAAADWRSQLEQENHRLAAEAAEPDALQIEIRQAEKNILLNEYSLQHNLPPETNAWSFAGNLSGNIIFAVSLISIIIAGEIAAAEFVSGTIKLLLTRSASRTEIYTAKYVAAILFGLGLTLVGLLLSLLFGGIMFGWGGLGDSYMYVRGHAVHQTPMLLSILGSYLFHLPFLLISVTLAFMISAGFRSPIFAIVIPLFVTVAGFVIAIAMNGWPWTRFFIFSHSDLSGYFLGDPAVKGMTLGFSLAFIGLHLAVMHLLSHTLFVKRDVS